MENTFEPNETKIITRFLFFPKTINGIRKWWCKATYLCRLEHRFDVTCGAEWYEKVPIRWLVND